MFIGKAGSGLYFLTFESGRVVVNKSGTSFRTYCGLLFFTFSLALPFALLTNPFYLSIQERNFTSGYNIEYNFVAEWKIFASFDHSQDWISGNWTLNHLIFSFWKSSLIPIQPLPHFSPRLEDVFISCFWLSSGRSYFFDGFYSGVCSERQQQKTDEGVGKSKIGLVEEIEQIVASVTRWQRYFSHFGRLHHWKFAQ